MFLLLACAEPVALDSTPTAFDLELAQLDAQLDAPPSDDWGRVALVASTQMTRARLTGDLDDYAQAEALLDRAFELAPDGSGPHLLAARLDYSLHRLDRVEAHLVAAESRLLLDDAERAAILTLRGDVAFQTGDYDRARALHATSQALHPSIGATVSQAHAAWRVLDFERAEELFDAAEAQYHGPSDEPRAWFDLQRGLLDLDRGRYDDALVHYLDAAHDLDGYWLVDEHIAEILVLQGRQDEARAIYIDVVERTDKPEFMGALAELSDGREAERWAERAGERYDRMLVRFPESAAGHALEHELAHGDPSEALVLARNNAALRPNGEALTRLAEAQLAVGHPGEAMVTVDEILASSWRSADTLVVAAAVARANGRLEQASELHEQALAIDPHALD